MATGRDKNKSLGLFSTGHLPKLGLRGCKSFFCVGGRRHHLYWGRADVQRNHSMPHRVTPGRLDCTQKSSLKAEPRANEAGGSSLGRETAECKWRRACDLCCAEPRDAGALKARRNWPNTFVRRSPKSLTGTGLAALRVGRQ